MLLTALRTNRLRIVLNLAAYFPVLLFLIVGTGLGVALVSIGKLLGPNKPDTEKNAPYECGFEAFEDARMKFDVRYYLVAILFIIFDLETAFPVPVGRGIARHRLGRVHSNDDFPARVPAWFCLHLEEGRPRLGMMD
ncbi:NADH-quinone oxidoreductase subunit A [Paraburkholderia youngii]